MAAEVVEGGDVDEEQPAAGEEAEDAVTDPLPAEDRVENAEDDG